MENYLNGQTANHVTDFENSHVNGMSQEKGEKQDVENGVCMKERRANDIQNRGLREAWGDKSAIPVAENINSRSLRKPNRRRPWMEALAVFADDVSVVGVRYVAKPSASMFRRSVWVLLILVGAAFTTYQIQNRVLRYASYPINVVIRVDRVEEMRFPTVTICNENMVSLERAVALGMEGIIKTMFPPYPKPGFTPDFTGYYYDKLGINWHAVYANVSQQPDEALVMCQYNAEYCSYEESFERVTTNMGFCLSFNPSGFNYTSRQPGSTSGLRLTLNVDQANYVYASSASIGFRILLQGPDEKPLMIEKGLKVSPGFLTQIAVNAKYFVDMPSPYGNCEPSTDYVRSKCLDECEANYVIRNCSCKDMSMPGDVPVCDPKTFYECIVVKKQHYVRDNEAANCNCPHQCRELIYEPTVSQAPLSSLVAGNDSESSDEIKDSCIVEIFFSELKNTYIQAEEGYTLLSLMCDIGGALGLILGSTMLTFCEFADFLFTLSMAWLKVRSSTGVIGK